MNKTLSVATFALIKNSDNKVLLLRRSRNDTFPGRWELPGGGIDSNESPERSIEREVLEETGLIVKAIRPFSVITHENHDKTQNIIRITYECELLSANKVSLTKDHDQFKWIELEKLNLVDKEDVTSPLNFLLKDIEASGEYFKNSQKMAN